jgi:hypothetical protein
VPYYYLDFSNSTYRPANCAERGEVRSLLWPGGIISGPDEIPDEFKNFHLHLDGPVADAVCDALAAAAPAGGLLDGTRLPGGLTAICSSR